MKYQVGTRHNFLTIIEKSVARDKHGVYHRCRCDCGNITIVRQDKMGSSKTKSCGCLKRRAIGERSITHGRYKADLYTIWRGMISRCENPKSLYFKNYGGRGIQVCERWQSPENFFNDMSPRPGGFVIDRIDNNGNYEPENCRWVTYAISSRNRRNTIIVSYQGNDYCLRDLSDLLSLNYSNLYRWIRKENLSIESAILRVSEKKSKGKTNSICFSRSR